MTERTWHVPAHRQAVPEIRATARKYLADNGLDDAHDLLTVICELVTNAVRHGRPDITLTLALGEGCVRGEVTDRGPGLPRPRTPAADDDGGRGLQIVAAYTRSWGVIPLDRGKRVWFDYRTDVP